MAKGDLKYHLDKCDKCVETAPHQWDLCEVGQKLLRDEPEAEKEL